MSVAALVQAVRNSLRTPTGVAEPTNILLPGWQGFPDGVCDYALPGGKPPPAAGDLFVGVHSASWTTETVEGLLEFVGVRITMSMRCPWQPYDRWAAVAVYNRTQAAAPATAPATQYPGIAQPGLYAVAEAIRAQLHLDVNADAILNAANLLIDPQYGTGNQTLNGFVEPLLFSGGDGEPTERGGSWWDARSSEPRAGMSLGITFSGGGRAQRIEQMA